MARGGAFAALGAQSHLQSILLWNVVSSLIGAALGPYLTALSNTVNTASPLSPLSPEIAATGVLRGRWDEGRGAAEARMSGINEDRFALLTALAGNALAPGELAAALRRGFIDGGDFTRGLSQGNLRAEWHEVVKRLAVMEPSPIQPLDALLQGQLPEAEARALYQRFGGDPEHFEWLYNTQGQAPTPTQALELVNRGIIPWDGEGPGVVSFRQDFLEGPWRNKWEPAFRALARYLPPPRTVTALFREGAVTRERAATLLAQQGLATEDIEAYLVSADDQDTESSRALAQGTIVDLYEGRIIERPMAAEMLTGIRYSAEAAEFILSVADLRTEQRFLNAAIGRIRSLFVAYRINRAQAAQALTGLQVAGDGAEGLLSIWDYERAANVRDLTPAQVVAGLRAGAIDEADARLRLEDLGYLPEDAWLYLSGALGVRLAEQPAPGVGLPVGAPEETRYLTPAQVARAYKQELLTQDQAGARLEAMGYRPHEAWLFLSNAMGSPLPGEPPADSMEA